jgi:D-alanyl-lipoteichoic acid acyltransferase DltB (MBOAT superfamily)
MLFNSVEFAVFLPIVFILYWFCTAKSLKLQNLFVVISSYFFYGWWDWRFLSLIFISTLQDYFVAQKIQNTDNEHKRKLWLIISIIVNLGILGFFKYCNFFINSFVETFTLSGIKPNISTLHIILPIGISFYTFQTMSYTIDIYKRKLEPTKDFIAFAAFVSFFPLLVAGPIERATNLLSQFLNKRVFDYGKAVDGLRQILWGLFKKVVVADSCAIYVNSVFGYASGTFADPEHSLLLVAGSTLLIGAIFFAFQIYCDFSGYSDIAIGTARLFGFNAMRNFNFPYFSRDIAEFWRRWHISLTTWFRDYVYIPLGGSRVSKAKVVRNTFIIFLVSGFWHGANWTFIIWGVIHAILFLPLILMNKNRKYTDTIADGKFLPSTSEIFQIAATFFLVLIGWIIFRAENIGLAVVYLKGMMNKSLFSLGLLYQKKLVLETTILIIIMLIIEWVGRKNQFGLEKFGLNWNRVPRYIFYLVISFVVLTHFSPEKATEFIYFQF